jgi:hypothetical protein
MTKIKLNFSQIQLLVKENCYQVDEKNKFLAVASTVVIKIILIYQHWLCRGGIWGSWLW